MTGGHLPAPPRGGTVGSPQGTRGRLGGVCYKHLCVFSHADHRPQGTDTPSRGEAGSGRGATVALGPRLGWGTAPRYLHRAHNQGTAPPQTAVAPRGSSHLSRRKDSSVASWDRGSRWGRPAQGLRLTGLHPTRPSLCHELCWGCLGAHTCPGPWWKRGDCAQSWGGSPGPLLPTAHSPGLSPQGPLCSEYPSPAAWSLIRLGRGEVGGAPPPCGGS